MKPIQMANLPTPAKCWEVKNAAEGAVDVYIYGDIIYEEDRWWYGEGGPEVSAVSFRDELEAAGDVSTINLYVASAGGSFPQALAIHSILSRHPATVNGYVDGFAASAATMILAACDTVSAPVNAMLLYHLPLTTCCGYFNAADLREMADGLERFEPQFYATYKGKNPNLVWKDFRTLCARDCWITAAEAAEHGLVDVVVDEMPLAARARDVLAAAHDLPDSLKAALAKGVEEPEGVTADHEAELAECRRCSQEVTAKLATL